MKTFFIATTLLLSFSVAAQSKKELQEENSRLKATNELHAQKIELLERQVYIQQKEIETLRDIMRGYVYQIDSLNTRLQEFEGNTDE